MTFIHEESATTTASAAEVFELWGDVTTWATWDPSVEAAVMSGPFRVGTTGQLTLVGGAEVPFELTAVEPDARYLGELTLGELVICIDRRVEDAEGGAEITVRTTVDGPDEDEAGQQVRADAPAALARLCEVLERRGADQGSSVS